MVASKGGAPTNPDWYRNLVANPEVTLEVGDKKFTTKAMPVESEGRRKALYDKHAAENPVFREYLTKTDRRIPVVVLEPKSA